MKIRFLIIFMMAMLISNYANATNCSSTGGNYTYSGTLTMQQDAPIGYMTSKINSIGEVWNINCIPDTEADMEIYWTLTVSSAPVPGYTNVYPTDMKGIGVMYNFMVSAGSKSFCNVQFDDHIDNSLRFYTCLLPKGTTNQTFSLGASLQFVKLQNDVTSGVVTSIPIVGSSYGRSDRSGRWSLNYVWPGNGSVIINVAACSINTPTLTFPIGNVPVSNFGSSVGTIPNGGQNSQSLGLNCNPNANINVSLMGTQNPDVGTTSVLALTGQGDTGVAKGVGVQILYNGSPLVLNNRIALKQSSGGQETFPFTARYYQTKTSVTQGTANASATLNLTYQ